MYTVSHKIITIKTLRYVHYFLNLQIFSIYYTFNVISLKWCFWEAWSYLVNEFEKTCILLGYNNIFPTKHWMHYIMLFRPQKSRTFLYLAWRIVTMSVIYLINSKLSKCSHGISFVTFHYHAAQNIKYV